MKTPTKAIIASVVVIALCLCTVGGVTHSWYSSSDQSEISIDTAKVDIEMDVTGIQKISGIGTATLNTDDSISITQLAPSAVFNVTYTVSNGDSDIDIIYRVYIAFDANAINDEAEPHIQIWTNGSGKTSLSEATDIGGQKAIVIQDWTSMKVDGADDELGFFIGADQDLNTPLGSTDKTFTLKAEAFQSNYPIPMENGSVEINGDAPNVSGEVNLANGGAGETVRTNVSFDETAAKTANGKTLTVTATSGTTSGSGFQIGSETSAVTLDLKLDNSSQDFGTGTATITATVPMATEPSEVSVVYNGIGMPPTVNSWYWSDGNLTVMFTTSHFSEFIIIPSDSVTVTDEKAFIAAMKTGMKVTLGADIIRKTTLRDVTTEVGGTVYPCSDAVCITKDCSLDLNGHTLTNFSMFVFGCELTVTDSSTDQKGTMATDMDSIPDAEKPISTSPYVIFGYFIYAANNGNATIDGGNYLSDNMGCVYVESGHVTINDGTFDATGNNVRFTLNLYDAAGKDGTAVIEVKGGTFYNYDPSASASENPIKDFVPEGYAVTSATSGEDTLYTVSAEAA